MHPRCRTDLLPHHCPQAEVVLTRICDALRGHVKELPLDTQVGRALGHHCTAAAAVRVVLDTHR